MHKSLHRNKRIALRKPHLLAGTAIAAICVLIGTTSSPSSALPATDASLTKDGPAWEDNFNGNSLDLTKWNTPDTGPRADAINTADALCINNGRLRISNYSQVNPASGALEHYSTMLRSKGQFQAKYGYFEARVRFVDRPGTWSAYWLTSPLMQPAAPGEVRDPADIGTEMDIVEHRVQDVNNAPIADRGLSSVHWGGYEEGGDATASPLYSLPEPNTDYHVYGWNWTPTSMQLFIDGKLKWEAPADIPISNTPEYIVLSKEIANDTWAGDIPKDENGNVIGYGPKGASTNAVMDVDWVKYYPMKNN